MFHCQAKERESHLFKDSEIEFEKPAADKAGFLTSERQNVVQHGVEEMRAGVRLHGPQPVLRVQLDLNTTSSRRESTSLHNPNMGDEAVPVNLLTV